MPQIIWKNNPPTPKDFIANNGISKVTRQQVEANPQNYRKIVMTYAENALEVLDAPKVRGALSEGMRIAKKGGKSRIFLPPVEDPAEKAAAEKAAAKKAAAAEKAAAEKAAAEKAAAEKAAAEKGRCRKSGR